ncbi:MAG: response regulator, partial [Bacteroidetes bacterium]|nr:response regulator [Bacteroidota bacterium]
LLDSIPDLISYKDNGGTYLGCNKSYSIFSGKSVDELKGKTDYNLFPKEKADVFTEKEKQILSTGRPWRNKDWERNSYGQRLLLDALKTPFYSPDGEILGIISISRDMTAMKQAEEKIVKLSHAVEQSPVSIIITDVSGNVDYVNPMFEKMTGYSPDEIIGKNLRILKSGKVTNSTYKNLWDTISKGKTWSGELFNKKKDDLLYWDYTVISPIFGESGEIVNYIATKEDVSIKKKQAEELLKAKVTAENANLIKSQFLSKMSHEIRTPMNGVVSSIEFLENTEQSEEQKEYTEIIKNSSEELILKLKDIFDVSELEDNNINLEKSPFNLPKCINNVISNFDKEIKEKGLRLQTQIDKTIPESVIGDKLRLGQIIRNLMSNAVKFTKFGEILISAKLDEISDNIAKIKVKVKDTGVGISKVAMDKLFKAYVGGDDTDMRHHDGMGLGLVLSKRLISLMNGNIVVESEENRGSTFTFTAELEIDPNEPKIIEKSTVDCTGLRILVVDPRENSRKLITSSLSEWGCVPTEANSAEEGFKLLNTVAGISKRMFDIAIVDSVLPDADGMIFARTIRSNKYIRDTKLILINTSTTISEKDFKLAGYYALLDKPIDFTLLKKKLSDIKKMRKISKPVVLSENFDDKSSKSEIISQEKDPANQAHVLLVDDNSINLKVGGLALKKMKFSYDEATNGKISVEKFKENKYDFILMDIQMPEMDGIEATKIIRELERTENRKRIPIIALTAKSTEGNDEVYLDAGFDELVSKPFKPNDLSERLKKYV